MSELRVPVVEFEVRLFTVDGAQCDTVIFQAPGESLEDIFESELPFLPGREAKTFRLYARAGLASVARRKTTPGGPDVEENGLPWKQKSIVVQLRGGVTLKGDVFYVAEDNYGRPADFLNMKARSFALHQDEWIHQIVKRHVQFVDGI